MRPLSTPCRRRPSARDPRTRAGAAALAAVLLAASAPRPARAGDAAASAPSATAAVDASNVEAARRHFEKARADYAQGSYREAIAELEAAHSLDPSAKDLVFNLGVVHEKLSDIDDALQWFRLYTTMDLTPAERDRADAYIRRLEGAKKEVGTRSAFPAPPTELTAAEPPPPEPPPAPRGRIDVATVSALAVTVLALGAGVVLAVKADDDRPGAGFVTGRDGTYADLADRTATAHHEAIAADIAFGVSLGAAITTAVLYFARTRDAPSPVQGARPPSVSAAPLMGGGAIFVQGSL